MATRRAGAILFALASVFGGVVTIGRSATAAPPPVVHPSRVASETFGADGHALVGTNLAPTRTVQLQAMATAGITFVRREAAWNEIEPQAPNVLTGARTYVWTAYDQFAVDVANSGLRWEPILYPPPCWTAPQPYRLTCQNYSTYPPSHVDFNAFVMAFTQRYGRNGSFWSAHPSLPYKPVTTYEVWNEENEQGAWLPQPDPSAFASLYSDARYWIVQVDPQATVLIGGLAKERATTRDISGNITHYQDTAFLQGMYQAAPQLRGATPAIGVGYHPYDTDPASVEARVEDLRHAINAAPINDPGLQIYVTESGWAWSGTQDSTPFLPEVNGTSGRPYALQTVADQLSRSNCGVRQFVVFSWVSSESTQNRVDWTGIYDHNANPYLSGTAYSSEVQTLQGQNPAIDPTQNPTYAPTVQLC